MGKRETVEEFLARGGKITKCPMPEPRSDDVTARGTTRKPVVLLSWAEADLLYGEKKVSTAAPKKAPALIDLSLIPDDLKKELGLDELED